MDHELEAVFKTWLENAERKWHMWDNNPATSEQVYWKDVAPHKYILRHFYLRNGKSICWGAVDCCAQPLQTCTNGKHETCEDHRASCFLCKAENESHKQK